MLNQSCWIINNMSPRFCKNLYLSIELSELIVCSFRLLELLSIVKQYEEMDEKLSGIERTM